MRLIDAEAFICEIRKIYCEDCVRRKGIKSGKMRFCYEIGGVPCRACDIEDVLDALDDYAPTVQPEPKRGKWIKKHRHYGGFRSYTGFDAMGEQHTITVDERTEYDDLYCSECGARSADNFLNFCPNCGVDMREVTT